MNRAGKEKRMSLAPTVTPPFQLRKPLPIAFLLIFGLVGCAGLKSEYGSFTTIKYPEKTEQDEILLTTSRPNQAYKEIGVIKVEAKSRTPLEQINSELLKKAREAGADGVIEIQYSGGNRHVGMVGGEPIVFASRRYCQGTAIVFVEKK